MHTVNQHMVFVQKHFPFMICIHHIQPQHYPIIFKITCTHDDTTEAQIFANFILNSVPYEPKMALTYSRSRVPMSSAHVPKFKFSSVSLYDEPFLSYSLIFEKTARMKPKRPGHVQVQKYPHAYYSQTCSKDHLLMKTICL